jgi:hypothetical protein
MNDCEPNRAEAIRHIAGLLATAYLRLRFPEFPQKQVDCPETESAHVTAG